MDDCKSRSNTISVLNKTFIPNNFKSDLTKREDLERGGPKMKS